jgi:hypothetical protein
MCWGAWYREARSSVSNLINRLKALENFHGPPQIEIWVANEDGTSTNPQTGEVRTTGDSVVRFTLDIGKAVVVDDDL